MTTEEAVRRCIDAWMSGWRALDPEPIASSTAQRDAWAVEDGRIERR